MRVRTGASAMTSGNRVCPFHRPEPRGMTCTPRLSKNFMCVDHDPYVEFKYAQEVVCAANNADPNFLQQTRIYCNRPSTIL